ncbi:MAG: CPBP family intramembrane glutamic endopeptidase [Myxococcota bacterium]
MLGLKVPVRELGIALVVFLVAWWSARWILVDYVSSYLEVDPRNSLPALVQQTFQVLNDEMVMRAALMTVCLRFVQRTAWAVVSMAAVFALGHVALYGWLGTAMHLSTVITLFSFGVVANTLFVRFGHIAYPFALHLAWNSHRFSTSYALDGTRLSPGQAFNLIEGNPAITSGSVVVMLLVFSLFLRTIPPEVTTCKTLSHAR